MYKRQVLYHCAFCNFDAAEQNAVFDFALDDASVCSHDIFSFCAFNIAGRVVIAYFGVNGIRAEMCIRDRYTEVKKMREPLLRSDP